MRKRFVITMASLLAVSLLAATASATPASATNDPPGVAFGVVKMDGNQEISPTGQPGAGDLDGKGKFAFVAFGDTFCYILTVRKIEPAVFAHIHQNVRGANGGIAFFLTAPTEGLSFDCLKADPDTTPNTPMVLVQSELDALIADPAGFYANVHNVPFPAGAVRGQLR